MVSDVDRWAHQAFNRSGFRDRRNRKRLVTLAAAMAERPGKTLPGLFEKRSDLKAAYLLFSHPEATPEALQKSHRDQVLWQLRQPGSFLLIEDTTEMAWPKDVLTDGLGILSGKQQRGFLLHSVLAVAWDPLHQADNQQRRGPLAILGLADQQFHVRQPIPKGERNSDSVKRHLRPIESQLWTQAGDHLGDCPHDSQWIRIADRGADIYEFLQDCRQRGHDFVVRAAQDRMLQTMLHDERKLFGAIRQQPPMGSFQLDLRRRGSVPARQAVLNVSALAVELQSPARPGHGPGKLAPVPVTIVRVWEPDPPAQTAALEWLLLVSKPILTFEEALTSARQYACRWLVEEYHKALKTGLGAEDLQLETAPRLFAAIAVMAVVALRLVELKENVRIDPHQAAIASGLSAFEVRLLGASLKRDLKTIADVALALGRLGGHLNRKGDGMPGMITLWRGWNELQAMARGARLALQFGTYGE